MKKQAILLTAPGAAAMAVVRLHGPGVGAFLKKYFSRQSVVGRTVHGEICDGDRVTDDPVVALLAEDIADVSLHGGAWVIHAFLDLARSEGFEVIDRPKVPLPEAAVEGETVIEREVAMYLPAARTELALRVLLAQPAAWAKWFTPFPPRREGGGEGRDVQTSTASETPVSEVPRRPGPAPKNPGLRGTLDTGVRGCETGSSPLLSGERGPDPTDRALYWLLHPPLVAIVGISNVGKSTLANRLFARARVIAADLPGTTRDWVGEIADVNGLAVMLVDTPGVRDTADPIEQQAIELSRPVVEQADLVVLVLDPTRPLMPDQSELLRQFPEAIVVINKSDRGSFDLDGAIHTVATDGRGVEDLRRRIAGYFGCDRMDINLARVWTDRQRRML